MTFVGKILVILIMALSLVFLGVTTVAFTTATNWKEATEKSKAEVTKLRGQLATAKGIEDDLRKKSDDAQKNAEATSKNDQAQLAAAAADAKKLQDSLTQAQTSLVDAQTNAKLAIEEGQARTADATVLRDQLSEVTKKANDFKIHETELNTQILTLNRSLDASDRKAKELRENVLKLNGVLAKNGISNNLRGATALEITPDVEGKVLKVDARNRAMEISIGSDDGISIGQELQIFRTEPQPEYLGRIKITAVDPDQAVAQVIGNTVHNKKIKEGDNVKTTILSR